MRSTLLILAVVVSFVPIYADTLRQYAPKCGIFVGAAGNNGHIQQDSQYAQVLGQEYSLVTAENACKFGPTEPQKDNYDFSQCDNTRTFTMKYNQTFRGHNLVWGVYNPSWLTGGNFNSSQVQTIMTNHISTVVKHYGNSVYSWDVVNEAVNDNPSQGLFKKNVWYNAMPDYVDKAFRAARAANPTVKLFYNDYNIASSQGWSQSKSDAVYNMLKSMKSKGVPLDGIGIQLHIDQNYNLFDGFRANIQRLGALGLEVHVTELDVKCNGCDSNGLKTQATVYSKLLEACLSVPSCKSFETWGFTDKYSWLGSGAEALPFDTNFNKKAAYNAMLELLKKC